ncbi:MAG: GlcG/HbpS family heme-binding protein [Rhodanobacteraceae bacterium]
MKTTRALTLDDARRMGTAAETEAHRNGWNVSIAVCDAGGHALWFERMDGAPAISAHVAPGKARTAALTGKPSKAAEDMINRGRTAAVTMPALTMEGGEPVIFDGAVIGAVGVSGARSSEDAQVARAGVATLDDAEA